MTLNVNNNPLSFSENFSVDDPPDILDENLSAVANLISAHLSSNLANFYKFGANLLSDKKVEVKVIEQGNNPNRPGFQGKCLELIELWIKSTAGAQWEQLMKAANESGFGGLETTLRAEFTSPGEPDPGNLMCMDSYCLHTQHR